MAKEIKIYSSEFCGACAEIIPLVQRLAQRKGISVTVVDVDECGEPCRWVRYTPLAEIDGKEVSLKKLAKMLEE